MKPVGSFVFALGIFPAVAAAQADTVRQYDRVRAKADTTRSYALQILAGYSRARRWPLLVLMDPRGRARIPLDCFAKPAAELGYVVMSSYDTRSDELIDPDPKAVNAILADATTTLAIDESRIYLAGFSGTARAAWSMAAALKGHVAGIVGFGAGLPPAGPIMPSILRTADWDSAFSMAGGAGRLDFNYLELLELADSLSAQKKASLIRTYPGPHSWPPAPVCHAALRWLHLRAMRTGLLPRDSALAAADRAGRRRAADSLETAGDLLGAGAELRTLVDLYDGWLDVREERAILDRLEHLDRYRQSLEARKKLIRGEREWLTRAARALRAEPGREATFDPGAVFEAIGGPALVAAAADSSGQPAAESARRRVEWLYVTSAFYQPRFFLEREQPLIAAKYFSLAERIRPLRGDPCRLAHETYTTLGDSTAVSRYLNCDAPR
jgi:predicted esterase